MSQKIIYGSLDLIVVTVSYCLSPLGLDCECFVGLVWFLSNPQVLLLVTQVLLLRNYF